MTEKNKIKISQPRHLGPVWQMIYNTLAFSMFSIYVGAALFFPLGPEYHRGLYAGITLCLIFIESFFIFI